MIIDQSLKNIIKKRSNDFLFNKLEKAIDELNFEDGMSGTFCNQDVFIEVSFKNSWRLKVWCDGEYSMWFDKERNTNIVACSYDELLKFIEKQGIRKHRQCEYRDAELYIIDFANNR